MGSCSKVQLSYGFILQEEEIEKLLAALRVDDVDEVLHQGDVEWARPIGKWLKKEIKPFRFEVQIEGYPSDGYGCMQDKEGLELAFIFVGQKDKTFQFEEPEVQVWGDEGTSFRGIPPSNLADEEFMKAAKEGFRALKKSKVFQEAGITVIVPQWILRLDVG
ncbi:hypothetical protein C0995_008816 [Termitomyces sp. Mi166|nr:hypothetical protein C0995_008816 [Termitomyces sp. Mi166\